jgi:hypothetical protein
MDYDGTSCFENSMLDVEVLAVEGSGSLRRRRSKHKVRES